jgi:hypothetical protein
VSWRNGQQEVSSALTYFGTRQGDLNAFQVLCDSQRFMKWEVSTFLGIVNISDYSILNAVGTLILCNDGTVVHNS